MSFPTPWKRLKVFFLLIGLFSLGPLPIGDAHENSLDHPWTLLQEHRHRILHLSSDLEALKFSQTLLPQQRQPQHLPIRQKQSRNRQASQPLSQEMQRTITSFWAAMATILSVQEFRTVSEDSSPPHLFAEILPSEAQRQWLLSKPSLQGFKDLVEFQEKMSMWPKQEPVALPPHSKLSQFEPLDNQIHSTSSQQTWIRLFSDLGFEGIQAKLEEYLQQNQQGLPVPVSNSLKESYIQTYLESRLLPIFHAHLLTQTFRLRLKPTMSLGNHGITSNNGSKKNAPIEP